jgi:hypothetical protein
MGITSISEGTFESIITKLSNPLIPKKERYFTRRHVTVKGIKQSRIYPNIPLIQAVNKALQAENLNDGNRALFDYVPVSDGVVASVTHADKKVSKEDIK